MRDDEVDERLLDLMFFNIQGGPLPESLVKLMPWWKRWPLRTYRWFGWTEL